MEPCFIPLDFHKFQVCGCVDCGFDATAECVVVNAKGETYYVGTCEAHTTTVQSAIEHLKGRTSPHTLEKKKLLAIDELFIQPAGKNEKCKFLQWESYQQNPDEEAPVPQPPKEILLEATEDWEWIENHKWWMSVEGEPLHMSKLETEELIGAVLAIREKNFSRITKRIEWIRSLKLEGKNRYVYPDDKLDVGYRVAGLKLEEFREVLEKREVA
jgi:hypothetical protein